MKPSATRWVLALAYMQQMALNETLRPTVMW